MVIDYLTTQYKLSPEQVKMIEDLRKLYVKLGILGFEAIVKYIEYLLGFNYHTKTKNYVDRKNIKLTDDQRKTLIYVYNRILLSEAKNNLHKIENFIQVKENPQRLLNAGVEQRIIDSITAWKYANLNSKQTIELYSQKTTWQILLALMFYVIIIPDIYIYNKVSLDTIVNRFIELGFDDQLIQEDASKNYGKLYCIMFDMGANDIIRYAWGRN